MLYEYCYEIECLSGFDVQTCQTFCAKIDQMFDVVSMTTQAVDDVQNNSYVNIIYHFAFGHMYCTRDLNRKKEVY